MIPTPLDLTKLKVLPLSRRQSLTQVKDILVPIEVEPANVSSSSAEVIVRAAKAIREARDRGSAVILIYGAHLLRNGAALLVDSLMRDGWITHLATNGAGTIHDWEYAWCGASTESVEMGVAAGQFGTWDETARNIHIALMTGALDGLGYGQSLGRFIVENGATLTAEEELQETIRCDPFDTLTGARVDLLQNMRQHQLPAGRCRVEHPHSHASMLASAWRRNVAVTVHPGIGYDIIANHPIFRGSVIGRAADFDFKLFGGAVDQLDGGVVLSIGSAIMGPQVFEKSISCVNNLRLQRGDCVVHGHSIFVVDLQDGGGWDWSIGEPPKTHPAYYLRFCKSYSRMGGVMHYAQCDNIAFVHHLQRKLGTES